MWFCPLKPNGYVQNQITKIHNKTAFMQALTHQVLNQYLSNLLRSTWFDCSWRALTFSQDTISVLQCHGEMTVCFANSIQESLNVRLNTQKRAQRDVLSWLHDDHWVWKALKRSHPIKTKASLCHKRRDLMKHYRNITPIEMTYHKKSIHWIQSLSRDKL